MASIWRRGNENLEQLDEDEFTLFNLFMVEFFCGFTYNWMMGVEEGLDEYIRDDIKDNILSYDSPGLRSWWANSNHRNEYPNDFVAAIDRLIENP